MIFITIRRSGQFVTIPEFEIGVGNKICKNSSTTPSTT